MRGDFSRFGHDSLKHYIATFIQQGRVQLDSDWNQNVENFLSMLWKQSRDSLGTCACIGDSFRIGNDIPIDHMLGSCSWKPIDVPPGKQPYVFVNSNDRPRNYAQSANEKGSLFVENAGGILGELSNLDLSRFKSIFVKFKVIGRSLQVRQYSYDENNSNSNKDLPSIWLRLYSKREGNGEEVRYRSYYEFKGDYIEDADAGGFFKIRFNLLQSSNTKELSGAVDISRVYGISIHWGNFEYSPSSSSPYSSAISTVGIGLISAQPMALVVSADADTSTSNCWADISNLNCENTTIISQAEHISISHTYKGKPTFRKQKGINEVSWSFLRPKNFNSLSYLRFAIIDHNYDDNTSYSNNSNGSSSHELFIVNSNDIMLEYSLKAEDGSQYNRQQQESFIVNISKPDKITDISNPDNPQDRSTEDPKEHLREIKKIGLRYLAENDSFYISEMLGELNLENDFLISSDIGLNHSARMYVNGILCSLDHWDTFLTQRDAPSYNADYLQISSSTISKDDDNNNNSDDKQQAQYGTNQTREPIIFYMAYSDVWNRGITHLEDPDIREIALGGPDTSTKLQTICEVKLKEIKSVHSDSGQRRDYPDIQQIVTIAELELKKMNDERDGRLSVFGPQDSLSLSTSDANYEAVGNHLYRIQIHDDGETNTRYSNNNEPRSDNVISNNHATFKWSKDNASVAFPIKQLKEYEVVLDQAGRSITSAFRIGDLVEIVDDKDETSEHPKGYMRRITRIDIDNRILSWSTAYNYYKKEIRYLHDPVLVKPESGGYRKELHPKVILWDGIKYVNAKEKDFGGKEEDDMQDHLIPLDGFTDTGVPISIKFDPGNFRSGDYWNFTTRSNGGVEPLRSAKPMGPQHNYAVLAIIKKEIGKEIEILEDLRHTFQPLTNLSAIDIPYDNGEGMLHGYSTVHAAIQKLSTGRIRVLHGRQNNGTINDLLVGAGEIYHLKRIKLKDQPRNFVSTISFNDIYQHQPYLMYTITSGNRVDVGHEIHMLAEDEEHNIFRDPVDDGTKNYAWKGFEVIADEDAQVSWLAVGDSYTYFERYVKRIIDEVFRVIFGVDTDQLKLDNSVLDAWHKKTLQNLSSAGPDLALQAKKRMDELQRDWDRFVRRADQQVKDFQENVEKALDIEEDNEEEAEKREKEREGAPVQDFYQEINCPNCGQSFPKGKYSFCTKCGNELPVE